MNAAKTRYALLAAADALEDDPARLEALIADDAEAEMTAPQVISALRVYAALLGRPPAPDPTAEEQAQIDRFGIFAEEEA